MTNQDFPVRTSVTRADINAIVQQAHQERAKAMRDMLNGALKFLKRLAAGLRPNRERLSHSRAWS